MGVGGGREEGGGREGGGGTHIRYKAWLCMSVDTCTYTHIFLCTCVSIARYITWYMHCVLTGGMSLTEVRDIPPSC